MNAQLAQMRKERLNINIEFSLVNRKEGDQLGDPIVERRLLLKWIFKICEQDVRVCSELIV
jgi:hypothetical protein